MLQILGENYYLDLDKIDDYVQIKEKVKSKKLSGDTDGTHISIIKYDTIKIMIDVILSEDEELDEKLGIKGSSQLSIPFKIAFNTLMYKNLLNKI